MRDGGRPVFVRPCEGETITDRLARAVRILADRDELTVSWFRYGPGDGAEWLDQYLKDLAGAATQGLPDAETMARIAAGHDVEPA